MNVFLRELRAYRKSTIIWIVSLSILLLIFMAIYPAFSTDIEATKSVLEQFPKPLLDALSLSFETFFTIYGFYGYLLSFTILAGAIQAMNLGTGVVAKEVSGKTADFLLSKPVTRTRVLTAKLAAVLVVLVVTNVAFSAMSVVSALIVATETLDVGMLLMLASTLFLVQLFFLALGALLGVIIPKVKSVVAVSLPTVFAFYIVGTLGEVLGKTEVRYATPFKFFDFVYMIDHKAYEAKYLLLDLALVVVAVVTAYAIYLKKDVHSTT